MRKLLDAGVEVFERRGFHAARVDDIVKVAKTSHGTFYLYFANKEELFRALAQEVADEMIALAKDLPPVARGRDGLSDLRRWLERFVDLYEHYAPGPRPRSVPTSSAASAPTCSPGSRAC
jgi:AcrR family transcriptional regulator